MAARLKQDSDELELNHEINVTPFIDVILVLLIIFMVAAPLATSHVPVQLPVSAVPAQPQPDKPVYITLQQDRSLYVGDRRVALHGFGADIDALTGHNPDARIFVRADKNIDYGTLMDLLGQLRAAGYLKVGLVGLEGAPAAD